MLQGVQTVLPAGLSVTTASGALTQASMVAQLQSMLQTYQAVADVRIQLKAALQQVDSQESTWRQELTQMKAAIVTFFGASSPQLVKFGLTPKATKVLTTVQKMERDARSAQTRALRGTTSKKAKQALQFTGPITITAQPTVTAQAALPDGGSSASSAPAAGSPSSAVTPAPQPAAPAPSVAGTLGPKSS
jgi:hypothetical protein